MPLDFGDFKHTTLTNLDSTSGIQGLENYLKSLEHHYFSDITVRKFRSVENTVDMALDIVCPIDLLEVLGHFNKGRWGYDYNGKPSLEHSFKALVNENKTYLDIEELTLFLNDASIVIKKIYNHSIPEQLNTILTEIANHYIFFTKGLTAKPYEIFVPVFEDNIQDVSKNLSEKKPSYKTPKTYFEFWGIYLDSEEDALIYDLGKNSYIPADLDFYMLED
ncbi:MAG: hypothetical protein WBB27_06630 [Maribacter sp.]